MIKVFGLLGTTHKTFYLKVRNQTTEAVQMETEKTKVLSWLNICVLSLTRVMCFNVLFNENKLYSG